jgi:hypothetical protein
MSFNLLRNARVFFTTNVNATTGVVAQTGFTATNTREIQVLDGLSFSQATTTEVVTLSEAGDSPVRGQRQFNTALDPVEFSFSTYIRPSFNNAGTTTGTGAGDDNYVEAEEEVLWNALAAGDRASNAINETNGAWSRTLSDTDPVVTAVSTVSFANSNKNQLQKFGLIIIMDGSSYVIDNCVLNTATIDFGLDAIATIAWAGNGAALRSITGLANQASPVVFSGSYFTGATDTDQAKAKITSAPFLANKLSTITVSSEFSDGTDYTLALTGGSIEINNNITYLTPANLGIVNKPVTYFTGTRSVTGTLTCYLRTGATNSAGLLADMLANSDTDVSPVHRMVIKIGGAGSVRVELVIPAAVFSIPSVNTEQVVSTEIAFAAHATATNNDVTDFDLAGTNEVEVKYYSNV